MTSSATTTLVVPPTLRPLAQMALLLERLERLPRGADAAQYRAVAQRASTHLADAIEFVDRDGADPADRDVLTKLLDAFPSTAMLYENLRYERAGLCRAPIEASLNAELAASAAIRRARAWRDGRSTSVDDAPPATPAG